MPGDGLRANQCRVLEGAATHGPILKILSDGQPITFILGLARGKKFLVEHDAEIRGQTVDLTSLFPLGAVRGMEGEEHRTYRRLLLKALQAVPVESLQANIDAAIDDTLTAIADLPGPGGADGPVLRLALRNGNSRIMMGLLYGLSPSDRLYAPMLEAFRRFGPREPIYELTDKTSAAFRDLQAIARDRVEEIRRMPQVQPPSMLQHLVQSEQLDETALGNLINVFEASHYDTYSLWHWILWYLAREPELRARIRAMPRGAPETTAVLNAIVWETLRLNQSESLLRGVKRDLTFDDYLIPGGSRVRVCLWESHKDSATFPEPFRFDPDRFLGRNYTLEEFAPFGLDKKRCIGADFVVHLTACFVDRLSREYDWEITADGPPYRSVYHWQPSPAFAVRVKRRERSGMVGTVPDLPNRPRASPT
jgi:cytochrome P450